MFGENQSISEYLQYGSTKFELFQIFQISFNSFKSTVMNVCPSMPFEYIPVCFVYECEYNHLSLILLNFFYFTNNYINSRKSMKIEKYQLPLCKKFSTG